MTYARSARFSLVVLSFLLAGAVGAATLPAGYTELEYVQGDGKGRVKTDYYPNPQTDKIEAVVEFTDVANAAPFGVRGILRRRIRPGRFSSSPAASCALTIPPRRVLKTIPRRSFRRASSIR